MGSLVRWSLVGCWCVLKWGFFSCNGASVFNSCEADAFSPSLSLSHIRLRFYIMTFWLRISLSQFSDSSNGTPSTGCVRPFKLLRRHTGLWCYEVHMVFKALGMLLQEITSEICGGTSSSNWRMKLLWYCCNLRIMSFFILNSHLVFTKNLFWPSSLPGECRLLCTYQYNGKDVALFQVSFPEVWSIDGKHDPKGILMDFCELRLRKIISGTETLWKLPLISPRWKVISSSSVHCTSLQAGFCFLPHATSLSSTGETYICICDLIRGNKRLKVKEGHTLHTFQFTYNICTYNVPLAIVAPLEFTSCISYCSLILFTLLISKSDI